jgi:hypothetical protein
VLRRALAGALRRLAMGWTGVPNCLGTDTEKRHKGSQRVYLNIYRRPSG